MSAKRLLELGPSVNSLSTIDSFAESLVREWLAQDPSDKIAEISSYIEAKVTEVAKDIAKDKAPSVTPNMKHTSNTWLAAQTLNPQSQATAKQAIIEMVILSVKRIICRTVLSTPIDEQKALIENEFNEEQQRPKNRQQHNDESPRPKPKISNAPQVEQMEDLTQDPLYDQDQQEQDPLDEDTEVSATPIKKAQPVKQVQLMPAITLAAGKPEAKRGKGRPATTEAGKQKALMKQMEKMQQQP